MTKVLKAKIIETKKPKVKVSKAIVLKTMSAESLISQGINKGISVDTMERLMKMRRELKSENAKEQFDTSMAGFQAECPVIKKKKDGGQTKTGVVAYKYAPLDFIVTQVKGLIKKHGFSYAIKTKTTTGKITAICIVKHIAGHSEESELEVPSIEGTQIMSAPQKVAAALTFAKRYAFCNTFGILTGDEDNDAVKDNSPTESTEQKIVKARQMINSSTNIAGLEKYLKTLESTKMSTNNKADLKGLTERRIEVLKKG